MSAKSFDQIAADNRAYVEAGLRAGKQEGVAKLLAHQYSSKTHFIFELLQNAEDAKATSAKFRVFHDRLEFTHNGSRLFTDRDVESITGIDDSNKDSTAIGRHGIGFKSVFAYTHCPRIDSGDLHFELQDVFIPERVSLGMEQIGLKPEHTRITLPFDDETNPPTRPFRPLVPASVAKASIDDALARMSPRTVLFLKNLTEIVWTTSEGRSGELLQVTDSFNGQPNAKTIELTDGKLAERWIVFSDDIELEVVADEERVTKSFSVEVAFLIEGGKVVRASDTELVVYFPTEKKTELGFLVQGPFSTTKARDNIILDDPNNAVIARSAANLARNSLTKLRDAGFLDLGSYEAFPLREADFTVDSFYRPFFDAIKAAFEDHELLPAGDNSFVRSADAVLGDSAALRELLPDPILQHLYDPTLTSKWLHGDITSRRNSDLWNYLRYVLKVRELDPPAFARRIDLPFLEKQTDNWFVSLYQFLDKQKTLWQPNYPAGPIRDKPFVRLETGKHLAPFDKNGKAQVFLPPGDGKSFQIVRLPLDPDKSTLTFFEALGVKPVGERDLVQRILETRYAEPDDIPAESYLSDIARFASLAAKIQDPEKLFGKYRIFQCEDRRWRTPGEVYLDEPLQSTGLQAFFGVLGAQRPRYRIVVWSESDPTFLSQLCRLAERVQVPSKLYLFPGRCEDNPDAKRLVVEAIGKSTGTGTNIDFVLPHLTTALKTPSEMLSKLVWEMLQRYVNNKWWEARFSKNQGKEVRVAPSQICCTLRVEPWVPQLSNGEIVFVTPASATRELLPGGFVFDASWPWLAAIGFEEAHNLPDPADLLRQKGFAESDVRKFELTKELSLEEIEEAVRRKTRVDKSRPAFPTQASKNPERRSSKLRNELAQPTPKTYAVSQSSFRTSKPEMDPKEWLYRMYENEDCQVICQLCQEEMPFRKRDRRHYFEAVELLSKNYLPNEKVEQWIALCPECQAKFKEYVKADDSVMRGVREAILDWPLEDSDSGDWVIDIDLGSESPIGNSLELRFVEDHARALRTILSE